MTMDRRCLCKGSLWKLMALLFAVVSLAGCQSALTTVMYGLGYLDDDADFPGLKNKTVAVVCRPPSTMQFQDPRVARDLSAVVGRLLKENGHKIKVIDHRKVETWCDANNWDDFVEVGKAVGADVVVGIDLDGFELYQGQTLFQGRANVSILVQDCKDGGKTLFEKALPQVVYPPSAGVATTDKAPAQFRQEYIQVLGDRIGRHFYAHDPHADLGLDSMVL
jgi:hypothetical protein